ncbi:MAG TPA: flagellin [Steroidobacteraceae bacterium]|nr:flagellin [Steroidobacteraceae bacterium]
MSLILNTNIDSLIAQNNLTGSQSLLTQSLTRLSSGLRINSAADDAAGLAIAQQFTTQINGTNQAINNANDAVSEAQTAGGALNTIINNLQSIRTLAVESANGSNSASDRAALDQQVQQQIAEIAQIASQTTFNGASVLNGTSGTTTFQVGANVGDTISINLAQGVGANQIGQTATLTGSAVSTNALTGSNLTIAVGTGTPVAIGASVTGTAPGQDADSAYAKVQAINAAGVAGLTATADTNVASTTAFSNIVGATTGNTTYALTINGVAIYAAGTTVASGDTVTGSDVADQINLFASQTGVTASLNTSGDLVLDAADGRNIAVTEAVANAASGTGSGLVSGTTYEGDITLSASQNIAISGAGSADLGYAAGGQSISLGNSTLANQNVLTVAGANATIQSVDAALATVSAFQSTLGAIQDRFQSAVQNLQSTSQNLTQSRSTIEDADFAQETANLTQAQVLEQAGISVLAQANQEPQLILKLLQ